MANYQTKDIRNIALMGHGSEGKTTLTEALLFAAKAIDRQGRVEDGNTVTDFDPEEIKRGISISAATAPIEWKQKMINIVDVPGYFDFIGEAMGPLRVVETAGIVVSAVGGISVGAEKAWKLATKNHVAKMFIVNQMDREHADFHKVEAALREKFGNSVVPILLPLGKGPTFRGVVNVLDRKAYEGAYKKSVEVPMPENMKGQLMECYSYLIEQAAAADEELMEKYFETGELTFEEIKAGFRKGMKDGSIVPVVAVSAATGVGIARMLDLMAKYFPSPAHNGLYWAGKDPRTGEDITRICKDDQPFSAFVYKTIADPFVGKLSFIRVYSGHIGSGSYVLNSTKGKRERIGRLLQMHANERKEISEIYTGEICGVVGFKDTTTGDTLCDDKNQIILEKMEFPEPVIQVAIEPKTKAGQEKMILGLLRLAEEDPTFKTYTNQETGQTIIAGMGELHLEIIVDRLLREFKVEATVGAPQVAYRETIRKAAKAEGRYVRQTGGNGQYGHCWIEISPVEAGEGYSFSNDTVGGSIPKEFIAPIDAGIREAAKNGPLGGYEVVDFHVSVYDGSYHDVDSSEVAFKIAGSMAFKAAMAKADPVLLEPIMKVDVTVPEEYMGDVIGDLNSRRGRIEGMDHNGTTEEIHALVPLSEMFGYSTALRSRTQGRGVYTMQPEHYEPVPKSIQEKVCGAKAAK